MFGGDQACPEHVEGPADWIIDLGPEGGVKGRASTSEIVAERTLEDVVKVAKSYTRNYLKPMLVKVN